MLQEQFSLRQFQLTKWSFFVQSTNGLYVHPGFDSIIELCLTFWIGLLHVNKQKCHGRNIEKSVPVIKCVVDSDVVFNPPNMARSSIRLQCTD